MKTKKQGVKKPDPVEHDAEWHLGMALNAIEDAAAAGGLPDEHADEFYELYERLDELWTAIREQNAQ